MERYDLISPLEAKTTIPKPLDLNYQRGKGIENPAPHFTEHLRAEVKEILAEMADEEAESYNLYKDGLRIETTINANMQQYARSAVQSVLSRLQEQFDHHWQGGRLLSEDDPAIRRAWHQSERYRSMKQQNASEEEIETAFDEPVPTTIRTWQGEKDTTISPRDSIMHHYTMLQSGLFAMDRQSGKVLTWVGGHDYRYFKYDQVKAKQQPASAFKPFVFAGALENGVEPCDYYRNIRTTYTDFDNWTPGNIQDHEYEGRFSVRAALAQSLNTVTVQILQDTGTDAVLNIANKTGVNLSHEQHPSLALGTGQTHLKELTTAYSAFANEGKIIEPYYIEVIYNESGEKIYENPRSTEGKQVLDRETAAAVTDMLRLAVEEGTGSRLKNYYDGEVAGKTGTTQNNAQGWFIGYTPDIIFGTRTGGMDNRIRFRSSALGSGSNTALPIAGHFLNAIENAPQINLSSEKLYPRFKNEWQCDHKKDDRFFDRVRDFFRGDEPKEETFHEEDDEDKSILDPRGWFD